MTCRCRTNRSTEPLNPSSTLSTWYLFLQDEQSPCRLARPWSSRGGCDDVARGQFGRSVGCKRGLASILCLSERGALATQPLPQPLVCFNAECAFRLGLRLQKSRQDHLDWSKSNRQSVTCLVRILHAKGPALCLGLRGFFTGAQRVSMPSTCCESVILLLLPSWALRFQLCLAIVPS